MTTTHALDFDLTEKEENIRSFLHTFAANALRPASIIADANEHERPMAAIEALHQLQSGGMGYRSGSGDGSASAKALVSIIRAEELSWGAASVLLSRPGPGLGGAAIQSSGTPAQKEKWLPPHPDRTGRFRGPGLPAADG